MVAVDSSAKTSSRCRGVPPLELARPTDIAVRTVSRIMVLNKRVQDEIPHMRRQDPRPSPQPHPDKACQPHECWVIAGRMMEFALEGVR
jgi:hypothetical protein